MALCPLWLMALPLNVRDALFRLHAGRLRTFRDLAERQGGHLWASVGGLTDDDLARLREAAETALRASRAAVAAATDGYVSTALELAPAGTGEALPGLLSVGDLVEASMVRARSVAAVSGWEAGRQAGAEELAALARSDIAHVQNRALSHRLNMDDARPHVHGYRRVPEGGTCGFCIAAASRLYKVGKMSPLHKRCDCDVREVAAGDDYAGMLAPYMDQYRTLKKQGDVSHTYVNK